MKRFIFFGMLVVQSVMGQDPQFTQFYAAPMYHNPAFTGSGYAPRVMMNYRSQWPSLNANFITTAFSLDHYIDRANSGIGLMFLSDKQGYNLTNTEFRLLYSYELKINRNNGLRFGLNGGYSFRGLEPGGLIFGDQLLDNGQTRPTSDPIAHTRRQSVNTLDVGAGVLYFNPQYYLGISMNHLTEPKLSFFKEPAGEVPALPRQLIVHGGYNVDLSYLITDSYSEREFTLTPTFLYKKQGKYSQLDVGGYVTYSPFTLGLQYRGIPLTKVFNNFPNQDAISGIIGIRYENFSFGYSYDLTISGLGARSGGSHEVSIAYQLPQVEMERTPRHKVRRKALACPKF
ncbi:MAG: type IX secretion system membrane protein PorP/SprF [Leadbetterella sp.]|nr:type IX secretion system membrane protein PorP/SprF [Leadbetterella sp.]